MYVPSLKNPAYLITRGLSLKRFKSCIDFGVVGPAWISEDPVAWPKTDLKCLRETDKEAVRTVVQCITSSDYVMEKCIVSLDKFSKLTKLVRMVTLIFRFINNIKHS